jgi:MFS family permease
MTALLLAAIVCSINVTVAAVAVPAIGSQFNAAQTELNLVSLGTGLGLSMSVLYLGALADRFGRKQMLVVGVVLTIVGSGLSALAPSVELLIAAQVFVGIAGGMAFPTTLSLISALWAEGPRRTGVIALWSSFASMASVLGAVLAGLALVLLSWQFVFLISVPIAVLALTFIIPFVPSHVGESRVPVDHIGGVLSVIALAAVVLGVGLVFDPSESAVGRALLVVGAFALALFIWRQARAVHPLYDLRVARQRLFWVPAVAGLIAFGALQGSTFVGEQFMQDVLGYNPLQAGIAVIPAAVGLLLAASLSARAVTRLGTRTTMFIGYGFLLVAFGTMLLWREGSSYLLVGFGFLSIGIGATFVMTPARRSLTSWTPVQKMGMASATSDLQSDLGGAVMQALLGAVLGRGFAQSFAQQIDASDQASTISGEVTRALQSSYSSASNIAEKYPQYADEIMQAAKLSLEQGALQAYLIGGGVMLVGVLVIWLGVPNRARELQMNDSRSKP